MKSDFEVLKMGNKICQVLEIKSLMFANEKFE